MSVQDEFKWVRRWRVVLLQVVKKSAAQNAPHVFLNIDGRSGLQAPPFAVNAPDISIGEFVIGDLHVDAVP